MKRLRAVFLAPTAALMAVTMLAPLAIICVYSFLSRGAYGGVERPLTLENYARLWDPLYGVILWRSLWIAAVATVLCLVLGFPLALFIARGGAKKNLYLSLVILPFWTSFLIRTYAWVTILKRDGLLNSLLVQARLIAEPLQLLYTPGAVVLGLVYTFLPFMILPIYTSVEKLDPALIDAALDLGAGPRRVFARVIVPLTAPGIAAGGLLVFVPALGIYAVNDILGGGKVDMIGNIIENQFKGAARNWPFGAALGVVLMLAFAVAFWFTRSDDRATR